MNNSLTLVITIAMGLMSVTFGLAGFMRYGFSQINEKNSTCTTAVLMGFRDYYKADKWNQYYDDYTENGKGRRPLLNMVIDGESVTIDAAISDYDLTSDDIGRTLNVRYRRGFAITVIVDDEISIQYYNRLQRILFWTLESIAAILLVLTILAYTVLPNILKAL